MSDTGVNWDAIQSMVNAGYVANPDGTITAPGQAAPAAPSGGVDWAAVQNMLNRGYKANPDGTITDPSGVVRNGSTGGDPNGVYKAPKAADDQKNQDSEHRRSQDAIEYAKATFPWAYSLGLGSLIEDAVRRGIGPDGLVAEIRNSQPYKDRFVAIRRPDGTLRMNEAQYMQQEDSYRQLLGQYGKLTGQEKATDFAGFFNNEIDPNELKTRLETFDNVSRSGQDVKDAFYVYAGMKISDEDLYNAVVKPDANAQMVSEFNQRVAAQPIDYNTWITRATEAGLARTADTLTRLRDQGMVGATAMGQLQQIDPTMARDIMASLHTGAPGSQTLNLSELQHAFQYALLGSAASANGLQLPSAERLEALRQAGVTRAKALQDYGTISTNQNLWQGELSRAGLSPMDQADFEQAVLLNNGHAVDQLKRAQGLEDSLGKQSGYARLSQGQDGLLQQSGLSPVGT